MQFIINIILLSSIILLIAHSFSIIYYYPTKFFHFAHAIIITLVAYFSYFIYIQFQLNILSSIFFSILTYIFIGFLIEIFFYYPLHRRNATPFIFFYYIAWTLYYSSKLNAPKIAQAAHMPY